MIRGFEVTGERACNFKRLEILGDPLPRPGVAFPELAADLSQRLFGPRVDSRTLSAFRTLSTRRHFQFQRGPQHRSAARDHLSPRTTSRTLRGEETGSDPRTGERTPSRERSFFDRSLERVRRLRSRRLKISNRTLFLWALISLVVCGLHLSLFVSEFHETWYAPLHFLWVVACACLVSWWCRRAGSPGRATALLQASAFLVLSCGISWAVVRVSWGGGVVGEGRLSLSGAGLMVASLSLLVVASVFARSGTEGGVTRTADRA